MATIQFSDGTRVKFNGNPTPADIEEIAAQIASGKAPAAQSAEPAKFTSEYSGGGEKTTWSERLGLKALANVPKSAYNLASGVIGAGVGAVQQLGQAVGLNLGTSQVPKAQAVEGAVAGGYQMLGREVGLDIGDQFIPQAEQAGRALSERYGITQLVQGDAKGALGALAKTATEDPVGFGADILGGAELAATRLGVKAGAVTEAASKVARPIVSAAKSVAKAPLRAAKEVATRTAGITTGAGKASFEEALRQTPFRSQPKQTQLEVLNEAKKGLGEIVNARRAEYTAQAGEISSKYPQSLDISPLSSKVDSMFGEYGIRLNADGSLDLSRSPLVGQERKVEAVLNVIKDWGTKSGDRTILGVDRLKQQIGMFRGEDKVLNSFVDSLKKATQDVIRKSGNGEAVAAYDKLVSEYGSKTEFIDELTRTLSLKRNATPDQAIAKLNSVLLDNRGYRLELARDLEAATGRNIVGELAKQRLSPLLPEARLAQLAATGLGGAGAATIGPAVIPLLAFASPRIMAELFRTLGFTKAQVSNVVRAINEVRVPAGLRPIVLKGAAGLVVADRVSQSSDSSSKQSSAKANESKTSAAMR